MAEGACTGGSETRWRGHQDSGVRLANRDARLQTVRRGYLRSTDELGPKPNRPRTFLYRQEGPDGLAAWIHQEDAEDPGRGFGAGTEQQEQASKGTQMKVRKKHKARDRSGSTFDSFLEQEGIREEVEAVAIKRVLAWQLSQAMQEQRKTKQAMAKQLRTSRSQLDRLLDPRNVSVTLDTITRAARALGKRVIIRVTDAKVKNA